MHAVLCSVTVAAVSSRRSAEELLVAAQSGDRGARSRLVTLIEHRGADADRIDELTAGRWPRSVVGVTGPPGVGKSTLVDALVRALRAPAASSVARVTVLCVDPSSPTSGGAILGDRVRMADHFTDDSVFIRSLASRGQGGGLSSTVARCVRLFGALGDPVVIVETVGVGQVELNIADLATTVVLVVAPGMGDEVQAVKAGVMEIADVFAVNKAERGGAEAVEADLRAALALRASDVDPAGWEPPVVVVSALEGSGVSSLAASLADHATWLGVEGRRRKRLERALYAEVRAGVMDTLSERVDAALQTASGQRLMEGSLTGAQPVGQIIRSVIDSL
jgi:LAO/AO transport system kinase